MKILVLGGGQMGSVIAKDLAKKDYEVIVADARELEIDGVETIQADLLGGKIELIEKIGCDLVVSALPAQLGYGAVQASIVNEVDCVDLSYSIHNILRLDDHARAMGTIVVPDAGIAPGITNLIAGRAVYTGNNYIKAYVGGFAKDEKAPLGYAVSWSTEDLLDEYIRPARLIADGEIKTVDALSGLERIYVPGVGGLDAFCTDGLRTLLFYRQDEVLARKATIIEKTMRREGHMDEMKELVKTGEFQKYVEENCVGLEDMLVMRFDTGSRIIDMVVYGDDEMSAMARSTALSCSAFAQMVAEGKILGAGVMPPEVIAEDTDNYKYLLDRLSDNGIHFTTKYPFAE